MAEELAVLITIIITTITTRATATIPTTTTHKVSRIVRAETRTAATQTMVLPPIATITIKTKIRASCRKQTRRLR